MITFIAPAHNEPLDRRPLIKSLLAQTNPNWRCIVYHNGPNPEFQNWTQGFNDPRVEYRESPTDTGAWGCYNRQKALDDTVTPWVIQTSIQDTYVESTVEDIHGYIHHNPDIMIWNSTNHLVGGYLHAELLPGRIDWGNAVVQTSYAQQAGINHPEEFMADWLFYKTLLDIKSPVVIYINKVLTHHK